ncbi:SRPBCC domain-containing protein [Wenxinia saemankumensis]|uniref:Uncharacterized conserved protein YndB, AHSA1/START domain n=1 Tax=Wenxinia saemankumensis TaxID=1447782 RepID=A0A1M6GA15_9RHOB|nr:SRPBCC domain-containing protein [Wenxinia saemankumensis]SHJ06800.1 Uncharacterized conserved protein YndB, AHSA1/START domain [Wenxinia saemankumensis]
MSDRGPEGRVDRAERLIAAPPGELWSAWSDPGRLVRWLPPADATGEILAWDFRPGGAFSLRLTFRGAPGKTSDDTDVIAGRFVRVEAPGILAHEGTFDSADPAFAGTMRLTWTFAPEGSGTRAVVAATGVPPGIDQAVHEAALSESLSHLAAETEGR